ncbi:MAG: hypothetical protein QXS21_05965 [Thermoproteota archaeon]
MSEKERLRLPSIITGNNAETWKRILQHYSKIIDERPIKILDPTAGERQIWHNISYNQTNLYGEKEYDVTFCDIRPLKDTIQCDYRKLPFNIGSFHIIIFDPPYSERIEMGVIYDAKGRQVYKRYMKMNQKYNLGNTILSEEDIPIILREFYRVLKRGGYLIIKIQDLKFDWHYKIYNEAKKFGYYKYLGMVIQNYKYSWRLIVKDKSYEKPQTIHTFWQIFKKE